MKIQTTIDNTTVCTLSKRDLERLATVRTLLEKLAFHARNAPSVDAFMMGSDLMATMIQRTEFTFPSTTKEEEA